MKKPIQHRVRELRTQAGLSQQSLADQIGVRYKTISDWERGIHTISTDNAEKVAKFFQVSIDYLLGRSG
ncbi:transcriptional regulator [Streptococcus iniae]|nr:transcriptional regulator [Streptococcus iniae]